MVARTGYKRDFLLAGQWFPKVGVWWKGQWNCHQFHASTEFFADYGTYDVNITLPSSFHFGSTGVVTGEKQNGDGTKTVSAHAEDVHDFAWTADPRYVVTEESVQFALREEGHSDSYAARARGCHQALPAGPQGHHAEVRSLVRREPGQVRKEAALSGQSRVTWERLVRAGDRERACRLSLEGRGAREKGLALWARPTHDSRRTNRQGLFEDRALLVTISGPLEGSHSLV